MTHIKTGGDKTILITLDNEFKIKITLKIRRFGTTKRLVAALSESCRPSLQNFIAQDLILC